MSAARTRFLACAVLVSALPGCGHDPATRFAPAPVERATTVIVYDALAAPVANATVSAIRLDEIETIADTVTVPASVLPPGGAPATPR